MLSLRIFLFGTPRIEQNDKTITISRRKVVALLAYLAVTGQPQSRDTLAALLWPDHDQSGARANLRRDLSRLGSALGKDALQIDRNQARLDPEADLWLDVEDFQAALENVRAHSHDPQQLCPDCLEQLTQATALYTDDFLAGFSLADSSEFEEWLFFQREGFRHALAEMLQILMTWHAAQLELGTAIEYGRRWLALDPLHEPAHRQLMQLYALDNQQAAALRQYQECTRILEEELGVEPEEETTKLYEAIKSRQITPAAPKTPHSPIARIVPAPTAVLSPTARYVQETPLATGGHGQIFTGHDRLTGDPVVIKRLKKDIVAQDPVFINRFTQESKLLRQLNHPNIVRMLTTYEQDGERSIVMEYIPGGSLRQLLEQKGRLPLEQVLTIGLELADALSRAHYLGIIHRDIKPDNVLLASDGAPRLTDFGTARLLREDVRLTQGGVFLGSPAYMSPEALQGNEPDARSDIWSLGVMLFEMIAGERPFAGSQITTILISILNDPLPDMQQLRTDVPPALVNLLQRMMTKDPARRIPSMRQVAAELEAIRNGKEIASPISAASPAAPSPTTPPDLVAPSPTGATHTTPVPPEYTPPNNLPLSPTPFVGRKDELARIHQLLTTDPTCRLLTLVGPGGIGKTRLAIEAARQALAAFPNGVFFTPLAPVGQADYLVPAIAAAIGLQFSGAAEPKMQLLHHLRPKKMLLLLDNFEHLLEGADLLSEILALSPEIKLLITSRERLNLQEEWNYEMVGLSFPRQPEGMTVNELEMYSAVQLFVQRARRADAAFALTPADAPAVARICQMINGMPLGLELAAPWVRTMTCQEIAAEIARNLDFLTATTRGIPDRHRSLRAIFEQSWQRLPEEEQAVCARMAIFRGGCLRPAAEQVAGATLAQLSLLVDRSLLRRDRHGRFEMHELIRQFALAALQTDPETFAAVQDRHSSYYLRFLAAHTAEIKGDRQTAVLSEIAADLDNVRVAWRHAVARRNGDALLQAAECFWLFSEFRGVLHEGEIAFSEAAAAWTGDDSEVKTAVSPGDETLVGFLLAAKGSLMARRGWFEEGEALMQQGIALLRLAPAPDRAKEAFALAWLAFSCVLHGRYDAARQFAQESLTLYPQTGDRWTQAGCLRLLGAAALYRGRLQEAERHLQECLAACQEIGERRIRTYATLNLGIIAKMRGETVQADQYLDEAMQISRAMGDRLSQAAVLIEVGRLSIARGEYDRAIKKLKQSQTLLQEISRSDEGAVLASLGMAYRLQGDTESAERAYRDGLAVSKSLGIQPNVAYTLCGLGCLALDQGQYARAEQALLEAMAIWKKLENEPELASVYRFLGHIATAGGRARRLEAQRYYRQALEWARSYGLAPLALDIFTGLGDMLLQDGDAETAVALLAVAQNDTAAAADTRRRAEKLLSTAADNLSPGMVQGAIAQRPDWQHASTLVLQKLSALYAGLTPLVTTNLPSEQTPFFGRTAELERIQGMLATSECRLITVVGLGGMGKSRLALEAAWRASALTERPFRHGIFFVPLAGVTTVEAMPPAIAGALSLNLTGSGAPQIQLVNSLGHKELLLLLDNFENFLDDPAQADAAIDLVTAILEGCPGVKLLITSREPLQIAAEWRLTLEGLPYAREQTAEIEAYGATQLFVQTAVQMQPDFALTPGVVPLVRRICQLTAGMPLALKLAAGWLRTIPLSRIVAEMESNLDILATRMRDVPARQRSMRAVFDYAWSLLTPPEREAFRALSVFRGGFTAEAASAVAQASPFLLAGLTDRGLVQAHTISETPAAGEALAARYEIHELARQYAAEQASDEERAAIAAAHAGYYANFVQQRYKRIQQSDFQAAIQELTIELNNVDAAWQWLLTIVSSPARAGLAANLLGKMAPTLKHFYYSEGPLRSARQLFQETAELMQAAGWDSGEGSDAAVLRRTLTQMQVRAAFFSFGISDYAAVDRLLTPAIEWLRQEKDIAELALALSIAGKASLLRGQRTQAQEQFLESLALYEQTDELYEYADVMKGLGIVAVDEGRYDEGTRYYEEALALHKQQGSLPGMAQLLHNMGTTQFRQGDYETAAEYYREALAAAEAGNVRRGIMSTSDALGGVQRILGNYEAAVAYHEQGLKLARELGEQRWHAAILNNLGQTYLTMGAIEPALTYLHEGLALSCETQNVPDGLASMTYLAEVWAQQGHVLAALAMTLFLVDQPQIRANVKKTAADLLDELQNELSPAVKEAAQKWLAGQTLETITIAAKNGPPNIPFSSNPSAE